MDNPRLQLELYVADVDETAGLFTSVFHLEVVEKKTGWRHLRRANCDIMLFNPAMSPDGESHWALPEKGKGGAGIEIVMSTTDIAAARARTSSLGYECSALRPTPWGSVEFTFRLKEGYLLRVKQPESPSSAP